MATLFDDIYSRAISRFSDYDFLQISSSSRETILERYLYSAISDFERVCLFDLSNIDTINKAFVDDLDNESIEILALGIDYYWFSAKVQNSELLRNSLSTKDYTFFSPANLLRELRNVRNDLKSELKHRITTYSYDHGDIAGLKE